LWCQEGQEAGLLLLWQSVSGTGSRVCLCRHQASSHDSAGVQTMTVQQGQPQNAPGRKPPVTYVGDNYLPFRKTMRKLFDNIRTEFFVTSLVLINMLGLLVDMAVTDPGCNIYENVTTIQACLVEHAKLPVMVEWTAAFQWLELGFLCVFTTEITLRLYAYGFSYFMDLLNCIDAIIVVGLFILQVLLLTIVPVTSGSFNFLRIVRLVRLVRLFVVMNKVQKAQRAYKKAKYLKLGSPVERVMELLADMKGRLEEAEDVADVSWIMHLISSDKLYTIDIRSAGGANLSSEMTAWLENMGMKKDIDLDGDDTDSNATNSTLSAAQGLKRAETKIHFGGDSVAAKELARLDDALSLPIIEAYLSDQPSTGRSKLHEWDFDVFDFAAQAQGSHLVVAVHQVLDDYGLISKFRCSKHRLLTFLRRIQDGYIPDNPYHNSTHALDVAMNANYFCRQPMISELISPLDRLAVIIAAAIHDHQHPGLSNHFLAATKHDYAITYNDQSILESHHVASAWAILLQDECNFLKGLSKEQYLEFRDTVIQLVLATDMKFHFEHYTKFKTKVSSDTFVPGCEREDVKFLLACAVHAADIANPAKPLPICLQWTELVMEEFFRQGDLEAKRGMPISPFYDREKTSVAQCQMGFINVLVKPLYAEFTSLVGETVTRECYASLEANLRGWETHGNELLKLPQTEILAMAGHVRTGDPVGMAGEAGDRRPSGERRPSTLEIPAKIDSAESNNMRRNSHQDEQARRNSAAGSGAMPSTSTISRIKEDTDNNGAAADGEEAGP